MAVSIHPTAIVDSDAVLDDGVVIGPGCVVGPGAFLGSGTRLLNHATIMGNVRMGKNNVVYPYCVIGSEPQDHGYRGEPTWVVIGDDNIFREAVTVHRATTKEMGITRIGDHNMFMGCVHIAHDVIVGSHVNIANNTAVAGHVHIHDYAALSALIGVHQFSTIGSYSFVGGMTRIAMDVPPFMLIEGSPMEIRCVNTVGLKRRGFTHVEIHSLAEAHRLLYRMKVGSMKAYDSLRAEGKITEPVQMLFDFLDKQHSGRHGRARERKRAA
jgi:UDP-N-acetylglucosamine acyltransferase